MDHPVPFRIDTTAAPPVVVVDGHDVADRVVGVELVMGFGAPTKLVLHQAAGAGTIEGVAEVFAERDALTLAAMASAVRDLDRDEVRDLVAEMMAHASMADDPIAQVVEAVARLLEGSA